MRNKKYRPWKTVMIILACILVMLITLVLAIIKQDKVVVIFSIVGSIVIVSVLILCLTRYFEIQEDRIIVNQGVCSLNKAYESSFKQRIFLFEDIKDITVEQKKIVWIKLKDGNTVSFTIISCFHRDEIIGLIYEVRAQIKGYEQQYI